MRHATFVLLNVLKCVAAIRPYSNVTVLRQAGPTHGNDLRIPMQLVMTAKQGSIDELPPKMRDNVLNTLKLNPELKVRFLNDTDCSDFLASNFDSDLHSAYVNEKYGAYRGDICRAAVIALEGGFYADLDVQPRVPFLEMVDSTTTFMTALTTTCQVLNALFAAERGSKVMKHVVEEIRDWYRGHAATKEWMGTLTMMRGLQQALRDECPEVDIKRQSIKELGVQCGPDHNIRLFREQQFKCQAPGAGPRYWEKHPECTPVRASGKFGGLMFGIFEPCSTGLRKEQCDRRNGRGPLLAWSRFEACTGWGCEQERRREAAQGMCRE